MHFLYHVELRSAIKGRNVNVVNKWLAKANRSKYKDDLKDDINEAERLQGNLTRMKGISSTNGYMS